MSATLAILTAYILDNAQAIAADVERDRLASIGDTTTIVNPKLMPKPSQAWAEAWASEMLTNPLMPGEQKAEIAHGLVWAMRESGLQDSPKRGDGGLSGCSMGVRVISITMEGWTLSDLEKDPAKCIRVSRRMMRASFKVSPEHPMAAYAGGLNKTAIGIADARMRLVKLTIAKLPAIKEEP